MYPEKKGGLHKMARPQQNWGLLTLLTRWASIWTMPNTASPKSEPPCGRAVYTPVRATILGHPPQKTAPGGKVLYKSDSKRRNTLGCLDQYTCNVLRLWNSRDRGTVYVFKYVLRMETMKQSDLWSSLGTHGCLVAIWWLCISSSEETGKFDFISQIWPWRSRSIATQNNRDLNQAILHLWSKFGDPSLNG